MWKLPDSFDYSETVPGLVQKTTPKLLTIDEAVEIAIVSYQTIHKWISDGKLKPTYVEMKLFIEEDELMRLLDKEVK